EVDSDVEKRQAKARRRTKQKEINAKDRAEAATAPPIPYPTAPSFDSPVDSWVPVDDNGRFDDTQHAGNFARGQRGYKAASQQQQQKAAKKRKPNKVAQSLRDVQIEGAFVPSTAGVDADDLQYDDDGYAADAATAAAADEHATQRAGFVAMSLDEHASDFTEVGEYETGPRAYTGSGDPAELFLHLRRCGLALERMLSKSGKLEDSDLGAFLVRHRRITRQQHQLRLDLQTENPDQKVDLRMERAYLSAHTTVDALPPNRPIVRTFTPMPARRPARRVVRVTSSMRRCGMGRVDMNLGDSPPPIACPAEHVAGGTCGHKSEWGPTTRSSSKKPYWVATCPMHLLVGVYRAQRRVELRPWAQTMAARLLMPAPSHPAAQGDLCTRCLGAANGLCRHWLCAPCCRAVGLFCKVRNHGKDAPRGTAIIRNISDVLWRDPDHEVIDVDAIPDSPLPALVPPVYIPPESIGIEVNVEHRWKTNPARIGDSAFYTTIIHVPTARGERGPLLASDFTDISLSDLRLTNIALDRLRTWCHTAVGYVYAYANGNDSSDDEEYAVDVHYDDEQRIDFIVDIDVDEIALHCEPMEEEVRRGEDKTWDTLRDVKVLVEAWHYSEPGYRKGRVVKRMVEAHMVRRRWELEDCQLCLNDINDADFKYLGLEDANLLKMDDGKQRVGGIDMDTMLDPGLTITRFHDDHELRLVLHVHGSEYNPRKRRASVVHDEGSGLPDEDGPAWRRRRLNDSFFH
ncbi:hypothetical protein AURDEDRAFT_131766, partial [Auricularia subglabra TFB-10046 SS5]